MNTIQEEVKSPIASSVVTDKDVNAVASTPRPIAKTPHPVVLSRDRFTEETVFEFGKINLSPVFSPSQVKSNEVLSKEMEKLILTLN